MKIVYAVLTMALSLNLAMALFAQGIEEEWETLNDKIESEWEGLAIEYDDEKKRDSGREKGVVSEGISANRNCWAEDLKKHEDGVSVTGVARIKTGESIDDASKRAADKAAEQLIQLIINKEIDIPGAPSEKKEFISFFLDHFTVDDPKERTNKVGKRFAAVTLLLHWDVEPQNVPHETDGIDSYKTPKQSSSLVVKHESNDEGILENIPKVGISEEGPPTGLIIDTRGLGFRPALTLFVKGEHTHKIYGPGTPNPPEAIRDGMCGWAKSVKEAYNDKRVGLRPIELQASKVEPSGPMTIWIDDRDLDEDLSDQIRFFFDRSAVVVVF